jgi:hypothetical protein
MPVFDVVGGFLALLLLAAVMSGTVGAEGRW